MTMDEPRYRLVDGASLSEAELTQMVDLLNAAFPQGWPDLDLGVAPVDYLRWKLEGPPGRSALALLTEVGDTERSRLVGMWLNLPRTMRILGSERRSGWSADAATHPEYQRRGLSQGRRAHWDEHNDTLDVTIGSSNNPVVFRVNRPFGHRTPTNRIRQFVAVLRPGALAAELGRRGGMRAPRWALVGALWGARLWARLRYPSGLAARSSYPVVELPRFDERIDSLLERAHEQFDVVLERDRAWLNWRYGDPRGGDFTVLAVEREDELAGYLVYTQRGLRGYVADLLTLPGHVEVAEALLAEAMRRLRSTGAAAAMCWLPSHHPYAAALRRAGFIDSRRDTGVLVRPLRLPPTEAEALSDPRTRFHLTHGDTDVV